MPSSEMVRRDRFKAINAMTKGRVNTLASVLPASARGGREADVRRAQRAVTVFTSLCWDNKRLMECSDATLQGSLVRTCQLGLELDPALGQAYLVPYKDKCQLIIGYRGFIALMMRSGVVSSVAAELVCEDDEVWDWAYGSNEYLRHKPAMKDRGAHLCVYAIVHMKDGGSRFRVMPIEDVNKIRDVSLKKSSRSDSPWKAYYEEMARKTAVRNLAKYIPQAAEAHIEAIRDEARDAGVYTVPQTFDEVEATVVVGDEPEPEPPREPGQEG